MSTFHTIELSDPRFEADGLRWITVKSRALKQRADITLFVPPGKRLPANVPVAILLHGIYGSHWAWALKGGAHRTAQRLIRRGVIPPLVLAMPSDGLWGDGSGYLKHARRDFERWIVDEVPAATREAVKQVTSKSPLFLTGLSMGGYGALRLGALHSKRFRAVSAHSSVTDFRQLREAIEEPLRAYQLPKRDHSVLAAILRHRRSLPALRFDCGTNDSLLEHNRTLHRELESRGIAHVYEEFPGGHEWSYWEKHLEDSLRFFAQCL